ncbi:hypothetical protein [Shimia abyssi]|uniref:Lipoprotein n=1 Tax=Shimia abyssi TaxID=1662395 RepID=A0A2P8FGX9_9RHOB|nr:hypothetical protein [Shimia abyssi]PSL20959.1 hypothetical protein CLV88_10278 [Shimia abyssi]
MRNVLRLCLAMAVMASLAACAVRNPVETNSPDEDVARARYVPAGPPSLTLYTMISNSSGAGAHTSLLISASERVAFDPAGSFRAEGIAAKNDVVYGMTPYLVDQYTRYHARETYHVVVQKLEVSPAVAELALQRSKTIGPVTEAQCAYTTSALIASLPGFEDAKQTYYPVKLSEYFAKKGASYERLYEYDDDDKSNVLADFVPEYELNN